MSCRQIHIDAEVFGIKVRHGHHFHLSPELFLQRTFGSEHLVGITGIQSRYEVQVTHEEFHERSLFVRQKSYVHRFEIRKPASVFIEFEKIRVSP